MTMIGAPISLDLTEFQGLKRQDLIFKNGEFHAPTEIVITLVAKKILQGNYFSHTQRGLETVEKDLEQATAILKNAQKNFYFQLEEFTATKTKFLLESKKATSDVKQMIDSMSASVKKVESSMNIDKLERISKTLSEITDSLARLEKLASTGALENVIKGLSNGR